MCCASNRSPHRRRAWKNRRLIVLRLSARFPLRPVVAVALGALHAVAFLSDAAWPLELAVLAALFALVARSARVADAARVGFAFGLGWFLCGISWIYISLHVYGEMAMPLAALATLILCSYLALYPALACVVATWIARGHTRYLFWSIAPLWTLGELARGYLFTGFPWLATGYAHVGGPLAGFAPVLGMYGITLGAALVAAALAALAGRVFPTRQSAWRACVLAVFGIPLLGFALTTLKWSSPFGPPLHVRLLQGDIPQDVKFDPAQFLSTVNTYLDLIERKKADLIVLPETALPRFLNDFPPSLVARLRQDAQRMQSTIALGVPIADPRTGYTNSVVAFIPGQTALGRYDKSHLVPFGEFVPIGAHWFVHLMKIPLGDFNSGSSRQTPMSIAGVRIAFNVCYEDLFGEEIIRQLPAANVLVNVSNVAWFGDSLALPEHLRISRMRALETARPMLRATNTGMTASIDPQGHVLGALAPYTVGSLDVTIQPMAGETPYARWGNVPALALSLLILALSWAHLLRQRVRPRGIRS